MRLLYTIADGNRILAKVVVLFRDGSVIKDVAVTRYAQGYTVRALQYNNALTFRIDRQ